MHPYSVTIAWSDEDRGFVASVPEFPNLYAFGDTKAEALAEAEDALQGYIDLYGEEDVPLPEPQKRSAFSGQLRLRMPTTLHARLSEMAKMEGCSLNTLLVSLVSEGVGYRRRSLEMASSKRAISQWFGGLGRFKAAGAYSTLYELLSSSLSSDWSCLLDKGAQAKAPGEPPVLVIGGEPNADETTEQVFENALGELL